MNVTTTLENAIDIEAVALAAGSLGLTHDVHIGTDPLMIGAHGYYDGISDGVHQIMICYTETLSATLWHELTHALQCERDWDCDWEAMRDYGAEMQRERGNAAMMTMPEEVEAEGMEMMAQVWLLARRENPRAPGNMIFFSSEEYEVIEKKIAERLNSMFGLDNLKIIE